jgi:hypothetical protein
LHDCPLTNTFSIFRLVHSTQLLLPGSPTFHQHLNAIMIR